MGVHFKSTTAVHSSDGTAEFVQNASIDKNDDDYKTYYHLSKTKISSSLYNTYDTYVRNKYKININYNALDSVKNYYR